MFILKQEQSNGQRTFCSASGMIRPTRKKLIIFSDTVRILYPKFLFLFFNIILIFSLVCVYMYVCINAHLWNTYGSYGRDSIVFHHVIAVEHCICNHNKMMFAYFFFVKISVTEMLTRSGKLYFSCQFCIINVRFCIFSICLYSE